MKIVNSLRSKNLSKIQKIVANRENILSRDSYVRKKLQKVAANLLSSQHGGFLRGVR